MTQPEATQKFQFRWTVLSAALVILSSIALLRLSAASAGFVGLSAAGVAISGWLARRHLNPVSSPNGFQVAQHSRLAFITLIALLTIALNRSDLKLVMLAAGLMLWTASVSAFLQITARYAPAQIGLLVYLQYLGDYLAALFLLISGADWFVVAAILVFAGSTAGAASGNRSTRLVPTVVLSAAALFLFALPPSARLFAIYLTAAVGLASWSAQHLVALAVHLREVTASASDGSAPR